MQPQHKKLETRTELGELTGYSLALPNPMLLISRSVIKESVASSNIENIKATVERVLRMKLFPESEQSQSDRDVLGYGEAVDWALIAQEVTDLDTRYAGHPQDCK